LNSLISYFERCNITGGDFNENILEGIESERKKYINDFVSDHQLCAVKVGLTYCHPSGQATSGMFLLLSDVVIKFVL
jgi:hypothetical protein